MLTKDLGYNKEQILVIDRAESLGSNLEIFREDLLKSPNIAEVAFSETIPGNNYQIRSYRKVDQDEVFLFLNNQVSYEYLDAMDIKLKSGRFFSKDFSSDSNAVVINEAAAEAFGFENAIGKPLVSAFKKDRPLKIVGVVEDYHFESLHKNIFPFSLELSAQQKGYLNIKLINSEATKATIGYIDELWRHHSTKPFLSFFLDDEYENLYRTEVITSQVLLVFATLSILIACMGLIGLITYTAAYRKKEIGIRKAMGAGALDLIRSLSGTTSRIVLIAMILAWPLAFFATDYWLQNFADRVPLNPGLYAISTCLVVSIVVFAISFQVMSAVRSNPIESLREE